MLVHTWFESNSAVHPSASASPANITISTQPLLRCTNAHVHELVELCFTHQHTHIVLKQQSLFVGQF